MVGRRMGWLGGAFALAILGGLLLAPGLDVGPSLDASIFSTVGWRLAEGDSLYADVWDHKPPGAYLASTLAHLLTTDPTVAWAIVWATTLAGVVGASLVTASLLARSGASLTAQWVAAGFVTFGACTYLLSLGGGMSETLALLPLAGALWASTTGGWITAGLTAGAAVVVSFQSAPVLGAIAVLAVAHGREGLVRRAALAASGLLAIATVVVVALWANGGLGSAGDALLGYSAAYRAVTARGGGASAWALVPWTILVLVPLLIGCGVAVIERRRLANGPLGVACATWILLGLALIALQGRFYAHYATPLVLPMAVLTGLGIDALARVARARARIGAVGGILGAAAGLSLMVGATGAAQEQEPIRASNARAAEVASVLLTSTERGDSVFVWGNDARVYELAGRRPASRYVYLYPLLTPGYATPERIAAVVAEVGTDRPAAFVDSGSREPGSPGLPRLLIERPLATDGRDLDLLQPLRNVVGSRYEQADEETAWPVYVSR